MFTLKFIGGPVADSTFPTDNLEPEFPTIIGTYEIRVDAHGIPKLNEAGQILYDWRAKPTAA